MNIIVFCCAFFKNVIYGLTNPATKALTDSVHFLDVLALRFLMSFVVLWLLKLVGVLKIEAGIKDFFAKKRQSGGYRSLLLATLFEPVVYMVAETVGFSMTTGITAGVILSLTPVTGCIMESVFLKEKTTIMQKLLLGLGIIGVIYIAVNTNTTDGEDTVLGIILLLVAILVDALFAVFSRDSSKYFTSSEITYIYCGMGALVFNAANVVRHLINGDILNYFAPYCSLENFMGFVFLGIVSAMIATMLNTYALGKIQVSTMCAFGGISTLTTILYGVVFAGEKLYGFHYVGLALILVRMIGVSYIDIKKEKSKRKSRDENKNHICIEV